MYVRRLSHAAKNEDDSRCTTLDTRKSFRVVPVDYSAATFDPPHDDECSASNSCGYVDDRVCMD